MNSRIAGAPDRQPAGCAPGKAGRVLQKRAPVAKCDTATAACRSTSRAAAAPPRNDRLMNFMIRRPRGPRTRRMGYLYPP